MKGKRFFGLALGAALAFLFAGCGNQQGSVPGPSEPTTVSILGVYQSDTRTPVDPNNVSGLAIVRAQVTVGSKVPDKVQFLLDGNVEYEVTIGTAGLKPQATPYVYEWNLNTAGLSNLAPKYLNGSHTLKVRVVKGTEVLAESQASNLVFNNSDFLVLKLSGNAVNRAGNRYYGGGDVQVEVVPVLYSGKGVQKVTLSHANTSIDLDAATTGAQNSVSKTSAPYTFTVPYISANRVATLDGSTATSRFDVSNGFSVVLTYQDTTTLGVIRAVLDGTQVLVDTTGLFSNNPPFVLSNIRFDYFVNTASGADVCQGITPLLAGGFANSTNIRTAPNSYGPPDAGAGGDTFVVDVRTVAGAPVLTDVNVPISGAGCTGAGAIPGLGEGGFFQVRAKAVKDALGNTWTYATTTLSNSFAIDNTNPTIALASGRDDRVYFNSSSLNTGFLSGKDLAGNTWGSTLGSNVSVNDPTSGTPPVASGVANYVWKVNGQTISAVTTNQIPGLNDIAAVLGSAPQGYYTLTVQAKDNAGNLSDPLTLNVLYDNVAPNVVFIQPTVTSLTGGTSFTATARATDNVDLKQGRVYWSVNSDTNSDNTADQFIRFEAFSSPAKAFGAPGQTSQDYTGTLTALRPVSGLSYGLFARVADQANNPSATATLALTVTPANGNSAGNLTSITEVPNISQTSGGTTVLTVTHSGGTAGVKAIRVYRWEFNDGTYDYYTYLTDAAPIGGGQYVATVNAPANLGTPVFLLVVEYDNGLARGYTYDYDSNTFNSVF